MPETGWMGKIHVGGEKLTVDTTVLVISVTTRLCRK